MEMYMEHPFETEKAAAIRVINKEAEHARARHITLGAGQSQVYLEKAEEAADFIAAGYPNTNGYPYIEAEVEATGQSPQEVADNIINAKGKWQAISAQIEKARIGGIQSVRIAYTPSAVQDAVSESREALSKI